MAYRKQANAQESGPPPNCTDLYTFVNNGEPVDGVHIPGGTRVMGVVTDCMPISQTRGTDLQLTFVLQDKSPLIHGLRFKFFGKTQEDLPRVRQKGDVVLLRYVKIKRFRGESLGMPTMSGQQVVWHAGGDAFSMSGQLSYGRPAPPTSHEQRWARTLSEYYRNELAMGDIVAAPVMGAASTSAPAAPLEAPRRDKFALIKNITAGDRSTGGRFYDLAGEVVKLFFDSYGNMTLYLCDYTVNKELHEYGARDADDKGGQCPGGKMSLQVELQQPHASWAHENVKEGQYVLLSNVRVKWNQKGMGSELEGNLWRDKFYPDKVCVQLLLGTDDRYIQIRARRKSYYSNVVAPPQAETKSAKKRKRRQEKKAALQDEERQAKRQKARDSGIDLVDSDDDEIDDDDDESRSNPGRDIDEEVDSATTMQMLRQKTNTNVKCDHIDIPISSFEEIVNHDGRWLHMSADVKHIAPFNNVKHHARLRVKDFYPHDLRDFTIYEPSSSQQWQWCFWLALSSSLAENNEQAINVLVSGRDAMQLLQLEPADLRRNHQRQSQLNERLFLLWGDLAEQKDKFLRSHPQVDADHDFSSRDYHIKGDNRPFDCCIAEYGVQAAADDADAGGDGNTSQQWYRLYKLFGTAIAH